MEDYRNALTRALRIVQLFEFRRELTVNDLIKFFEVPEEEQSAFRRKLKQDLFVISQSCYPIIKSFFPIQPKR